MIGRYYRPPFRLVEPEGDGAAYVRDADGQAVAMMMWAGHPLHETDAATAETYEIGRRFAASVSCDV